MNLKTAETLLPCYRPGLHPDSRVEKALKVAEGDAMLREMLRTQKEWDSHLVEVIHSLQPPRNLRKKLRSTTNGSAEGEKPLRSQLIQPAMLAVVAGLLVIVGLLVFLELDRQERFGGRDEVTQMLESTNSLTGAEFDPVNSPVGQLGDWFYMRRFEGYTVAPEIAPLPAVGCRVFWQNSRPVAQLAVDRNQSLVFVFNAADFGIDIPPAETWRILQYQGWAAALRRQGSTCTMVAFHGKKPEMQAFLGELGGK